MIRIIGISGKIGAGKDTLCEGLRRASPVLFPGQDFARAGFADLLKEVIVASFKVPREVAFGTQADKSKPLPTNPSVTVRDAMQRLGSAFRDVEPGYWVRRCFEQFETYAQYMRRDVVVCITDVRMPNEVDTILARGGTVIRLTRCMEVSDHPSETALDAYSFPCVIDNRELTPEQTLAQAIAHLHDLQWVGKNS